MANLPGTRLMPIGKQVLSEEVLRSLREAIIGGVYQPSERLVERVVAQNLGVSQGPVREAFRKLETEGLVETFPHHGTYVVKLGEDDMLEILEVRTALERLAAQTIMSSDDDIELTPLFDLYHQMLEAAGRGDHQAHIEFDLAFHRKVCELSGNKRLVEIWMLMSGQFRLTLAVQSKAIPHALMEIAESHKVLLDALVSKDMEALERHFDHNYTVFEPVIAYLRRQAAIPAPVPQLAGIHPT